jgi:hypothetical protein
MKRIGVFRRSAGVLIEKSVTFSSSSDQAGGWNYGDDALFCSLHISTGRDQHSAETHFHIGIVLTILSGVFVARKATATHECYSVRLRPTVVSPGAKQPVLDHAMDHLW